ncbi:hypothetical protein DSO57_1034684, partial [Entomophthora muscae]
MVIDETPTNNLSLNAMINSDWKTKISETSKKLTYVLFTRKLWSREAITTEIYIARFPYLKSKLEDWQKNKNTDFIETLTPGTQEDTVTETETETCPKNLKPVVTYITQENNNKIDQKYRGKSKLNQKNLLCPGIQLALSMNKDYGMYGFVLALLAQRPPLEGDSVMARHGIVASENHVLKAWIDKATSCRQKATLMISLGTLDQKLWQFKEPSSKTLSAYPKMVARLDFKSRQATISKRANPTISQLPVISFGRSYAQMKAHRSGKSIQ